MIILCWLINQIHDFNILSILLIFVGQYILNKRDTHEQNHFIHSEIEELKDEIRERRRN